jgi:hypothetical protein
LMREQRNSSTSISLRKRDLKQRDRFWRNLHWP